MTTEQIKKKIKSGDFITLGKMLGITPDNARMRFRRGKPDAIDGLTKIIESRERLFNAPDLPIVDRDYHIGIQACASE